MATATVPAAGEVVLGMGGCLDYEITWDPAVLEGLVVEHGIRTDELGTAVVVRTERDLVRSILAFVRDGVGGERFVASSDVVGRFAERFVRRTTVGGTPVRAALAMAELGLPSTVHLVSIDDQVRRLLPPLVEHVCSADHDTVDPHLIVQFPAGTRVRAGDVDVVAPEANRLIYVNDPPNREMVLSPRLGEVLSSARLLLVSGFNSMQDPDAARARVAELREHMRALPPGATVLYEDAGFHVPALSAVVRSGLAGAVDVHSMNEDELQAYVGRRLDLLDPRAVATALAEVADVVPAPTVVVHTRRWSLAHGTDAPALRTALQGGITAASARYLHGDGITPEQQRAVEHLPRDPGGAAFARAVEELLGDAVACVPAFVLETSTPTTIGLGDTFVGGLVAALETAPRPVGQAAP